MDGFSEEPFGQGRTCGIGYELRALKEGLQAEQARACHQFRRDGIWERNAATAPCYIALQEPVQPFSFLRCKPIGVMQMVDQGEQDDKIIAGGCARALAGSFGSD